MSVLTGQWSKLRKSSQGPKGSKAKSFLVNILTLKPDPVAFTLQTTCFQSVESIFPSQQTLWSLLLKLLLPEARTEAKIQGHLSGSTSEGSLRPGAGQAGHASNSSVKCPQHGRSYVGALAERNQPVLRRRWLPWLRPTMARMPPKPHGCLGPGFRNPGKHSPHNIFLAEWAFSLPGSETWSTGVCACMAQGRRGMREGRG
jgi:hypothetical protein